MSPITTIRNLGPASETAFAKAGITTAEEVHRLGANAAYVRLLQSGQRPHFIGYYVLVMGLQGRSWNDCKGDEKKSLRKQFDTLVATSFDSEKSDFERALDAIGVVERKTGARK